MQRYLDSLPPTVRERRKEARREKAQKKQVTDRQELPRKRAAGHETDSANASHGTPAKKVLARACKISGQVIIHGRWHLLCMQDAMVHAYCSSLLCAMNMGGHMQLGQ